MLTVSHDKSAKIWCAASGKCMWTFRHGSSYLSAVFSPDGERVIISSRSRSSAQILSASSGECLQTLTVCADGRECAGVVHAASSQDGEKIFTVSIEGSASIWSATSGMCLHTLVGHEIEDCHLTHGTFSPDGNLILTASGGRCAKIWSATKLTVFSACLTCALHS